MNEDVELGEYKYRIKDRLPGIFGKKHKNEFGRENGGWDLAPFDGALHVELSEKGKHKIAMSEKSQYSPTTLNPTPVDTTIDSGRNAMGPDGRGGWRDY